MSLDATLRLLTKASGLTAADLAFGGPSTSAAPARPAATDFDLDTSVDLSDPTPPSAEGLHLTDEVGHFILTRGTRSMSALFDLLERLDQASLQAQRKLTIPFLKETLGW